MKWGEKRLQPCWLLPQHMHNMHGAHTEQQLQQQKGASISVPPPPLLSPTPNLSLLSQGSKCKSQVGVRTWVVGKGVFPSSISGAPYHTAGIWFGDLRRKPLLTFSSHVTSPGQACALVCLPLSLSLSFAGVLFCFPLHKRKKKTKEKACK